MMAPDVLALPPDLVAFLEAGRRLEYDPAGCEAGAVELHTLDELRLNTFGSCCGQFPDAEADPNLRRSGVYKVPGVDLIKSCTGDYEPSGLLVWFPDEHRYGVVDPDHDLIFVFPEDATWSIIQKAPHRYINAQWAFQDLDRAAAELLVPWPKYPFGG